MNLMIAESEKRSIVKALTFRAAATVLLAIISWIYTGDPSQTSVITTLFSIFSTLVYFIHERIWTKIRWGTILHDNSIAREIANVDRQKSSD